MSTEKNDDKKSNNSFFSINESYVGVIDAIITTVRKKFVNTFCRMGYSRNILSIVIELVFIN